MVFREASPAARARMYVHLGTVFGALRCEHERQPIIMWGRDGPSCGRYYQYSPTATNSRASSPVYVPPNAPSVHNLGTLRSENQELKKIEILTLPEVCLTRAETFKQERKETKAKWRAGGGGGRLFDASHLPS